MTYFYLAVPKEAPYLEPSMYVFGPFSSYDRAQAKNEELGPGVIFELFTSDLDEAIEQIKEEL